MKAMTELSEHLRNRVVELYEAKKEGKKIVGFLPGDFVPEELIHSSGAIPVCLTHGGAPEPVEASRFAASRVLCSFSKTPIGLWALEQPYYRLIDLLVAPISCNHLRRTADMWFYYSDKDVFYLGVPHEHHAEHALQYYVESVNALKQRLEDLAGREISQSRLKESIELYNRMRSTLRNISALRKQDNPSVKGSDFIRLNHGSYYCDPEDTVKVLECFYEEMSNAEKRESKRKPRILLAGPNVAMGDNKVVSMIEKLGGEIVIEDICEGVRFYWEDISLEGDLLRNMGRKYLTNRVPCAFQGQGTKERMDFLEKLVRQYGVDGVVWYQLRYCETYNLEFHYVNQHMEQLEIPMIKIESDYDPSDFGQISTRLEAFLEILGRRKSNV